MPSPSGFRYQTFDDSEDFGSDEEFLRQVVAPPPAPVAAPAAPTPAPSAPGDWMSALQQQNPNWILQAIQSMPASMESGEAGPIEGYTFYDPSKTSTNDTFKRYDVSGNLLGEQKFKTPGNIFDLTSQAAADLAPILQYTPLGPAVKAIAAINAAREGDILPAIASAAGFGGYENVAKAAQAASALKNEDYLGAVLPALQASGIKDIGGYGQEEIGKALNVARAIDQGPLALINAASKYLPTQTSGFMLPETADPTEFWYPPEPAPAPSIQTVEPVTQIDPLKELQFQTGLAPDNQGFYLEEIISPVAPTPAQEPTPISAPERMAFLEANIPEPETVQELMQKYYPEVYQAPAPEPDQRIDVTGTREVPIEQNAFEQYMQQYAAPAEQTLFPEFEQPLLTAEPTPAPSAASAPASATPISAPERMAFLEANITEPETVQELMQKYYPEIYETAPVPAPEAQRIEVTGQRESPIEQTAFEQYMQQYAAPTEPPGMIEGPQTIEVTGKREPVLFPEFDQPLLTAEPMPTVAAPTAAPTAAAPTAAAPTAAAPATAPTPAAPAKKQDDLGLLMLLASMMTPQQQAKDDYQLAQIGAQSPYGIYGA